MEQLKKITEQQIQQFGVGAEPDILSGKPEENKAVFDRLIREAVMPTFNEDADMIQAHFADAGNPHVVTKAQVGLGNCDDTADLDKPVSRHQMAALNEKADRADVLTKGNLTPYAPTENFHPATKAYADSVAAGVTLGQVPDGSITRRKIDHGLSAYLDRLLLGPDPGGELADVSLEAGAFENAGAGWNSFRFREPFDAAPVVVVQAEDFPGWVEIRTVTAEGFLYCLRKDKWTAGSVSTGNYYVAANTMTSPNHTSATLVNAVTLPKLEVVTEGAAVRLRYIAIEDGGNRSC